MSQTTQKTSDLVLAYRQLNRILLGKEHAVKLALSCLLANGHLLIEDLPGMGKTLLANSLAKVLGLDYQRIQFTSDLLPADVVGGSILDTSNTARADFRFVPGPVFTQVLLADELNRASPKAQSALLEAMEEKQVSIDGTTHALPQPFFVMATQNPQEQSGTFALPESQLDRFLMCIRLGYPDPRSERALLEGHDPRQRVADMAAQLDATQLLRLQQRVGGISASASLLDYVQRLIAFSREDGDISVGLSPRGALGLLRASQSWAMLSGREHVLPEDVQAVLPAVVDHRLSGHAGSEGRRPSERMLADVSVL